MKTPLAESKIWLAKNEIAIEKTNNPNQVAIGGKILFADIVSRNGRHYVKEEVEQATNTLYGKPINVNHDSHRPIGHVQRAKFINGALEFWGIINNKTYAERARSGDPYFKGWSVQADYFCNKCPKCNERFLTPESFKQHMNEIEHVHNFLWEPEGIVFNGLAYVEGKEEPGVVGTTKDFVETWQKQNLQFFEIISKDKEEADELKIKMENKEKIAVAIPEMKKSEVAVGIGAIVGSLKPLITESMNPKEIKEQEEHKCEMGNHWDDEEGKCMPDKKEEQTMKKEDMMSKSMEKLVLAEPCSPELKRCVDALIADGKLEKSAWTICRSKIGETKKTEELKGITFKPIELKETQINPVNIQPLPTRTFEEMRKDGITEEASAMKLKETRIFNENNKAISDFIHENAKTAFQILRENQTKLTESIHDTRAKLTEIYTEVQRMINAIPKDDDSWKTQLPQIVDHINKLPKEMQANFTTEINALKESIPQDDLSWKESIANIPKDDISWKEHIEKHPQDDTSWKENIAKINESIANQDKKYDDFMNKLTTKLEEYVKTTNDTITNLKKENDDKTKKLTETENKLKETQERIDNVEDKVKPSFKGKSGKLAETTQTPVTHDPMKGA